MMFQRAEVTASKLALRIRMVVLALIAAVAISGAFTQAKAASLPSDDEQEILIRTTLMTFNDANMTGNYSVLHAKASKELQAQLSIEKLFEGFKPFLGFKRIKIVCGVKFRYCRHLASCFGARLLSASRAIY